MPTFCTGYMSNKIIALPVLSPGQIKFIMRVWMGGGGGVGGGGWYSLFIKNLAHYSSH